jgi:hypothetical protein
MTNTAAHLDLCEAVLALVERKRLESGDETLGAFIEDAVVNAEIKQLEQEIFENPGAIEPWLVKMRRP